MRLFCRASGFAPEFGLDWLAIGPAADPAWRVEFILHRAPSAGDSKIPGRLSKTQPAATIAMLCSFSLENSVEKANLKSVSQPPWNFLLPARMNLPAADCCLPRSTVPVQSSPHSGLLCPVPAVPAFSLLLASEMLYSGTANRGSRQASGWKSVARALRYLDLGGRPCSDPRRLSKLHWR